MVYGCVGDVMDVVFSVCIMNCMRSVSVSTCRCCKFVSCVFIIKTVIAASFRHSRMIKRS